MQEEHAACPGYRGRTLLTPQDVREKRFAATRLGQRGLVASEVRDFLNIVEIDLALLYQELLAAQEETDRLRTALLDLQSRHSNRHPNGGDQPRPLPPPHPREEPRLEGP